MQPLRNQIHSQLKESSFTLPQLAAMKIQLIRLKEEGKQITVTDDEVSAHVKKHEWFYALWFWLMMGSVFAYLVTH